MVFNRDLKHYENFTLMSHFVAQPAEMTQISLGSCCYGKSTFICHLYKALLYVHDIELVEIGVWWTMSVCFFFSHPTRPKHREIKMEKQKKTKTKIVYWYLLPVQNSLYLVHTLYP